MDNEIFTKKFCMEGYNLALDNAKRLYKISAKAGELAEFGISTSLNILAAEEAAKALCLICRCYHPEEDYKGFNEIFFKHSTKHNLLKLFSEKVLPVARLYESPQNFFTYLFDLLERYFANNEKVFAEMKGILEPLGELLFENNINHQTKSNKGKNYEQLSLWWTLANKEKNDGLYVGIENEKWKSPKMFSHKQYLNSRRNTKTMIQFANKTRSAFASEKKYKNSGLASRHARSFNNLR